MLEIDAGTTSSYCDGLRRRSFLKIGLSGLAGLSLPAILQARAQASSAQKDTSIILLWLDGGPSHMDTYDPKPEAPTEYRGIWSHIPTCVPGTIFSETLPRHAQIADKFSIIRSMHHDTGDHFTGGHWMLTGRGEVSGAATPGKNPSFMSIASKVVGARKPGMPPYVAVPYAMSIGIRPGYFGANYLGVEYDPFETEGSPESEGFQVQNMILPGGMTVDRLSDRRGLVQKFDELKRQVDKKGLADAMNRFELQAYDMVTGQRARKAFKLDEEPAEVRDRYGRHHWGQCTLLARRLVEAGSTCVTCHFGGWDNHWDLKAAMDNYLPKVDQLVHALFTDLEQRGILEKTIVVLCGEFSRTPRMNDGGNGGPPGSMGTPGRDHWGNALSVLIGGGGIKGGQIIGATNRLGEHPAERPLRPGDLHHTLFHLLGIDPTINFLNHAGRPVPAVDHGSVIQELV